MRSRVCSRQRSLLLPATRTSEKRSSYHAVLVPTIASRRHCLNGQPNTHSVRRLQPHSSTYSSTPKLHLRRRGYFPHLKLTGPERIVFCHVLPNTPQRICQILIRMCPSDSWIEVLDVYEGVSFVIEGAEAGNRLGRFGAEYLGETLDDAHEDVFAGDGWGLMPKVYC